MDKCPHIIGKSAGDEAYDFCEITERPSGRIKPCLLESGNGCEIWDEIQKEWGIEMDKEVHCDKHDHFVDECAWCHAAANEGIDWERENKPPLLSEADLAREFPGVFDGTLNFSEYCQRKEHYLNICKAQREADIKHYEDGK